MSIRRLLSGLTPAEFADRYFLQQPYSQTGTAGDVAALCTWERLERLLQQPGVDVLAARSGRPYEGPVENFDSARRLHEQGYTIVVRHAERHDPELAAVAQGFIDEFRGRIDLHLYYTPPQQYGFGWHYDAEDVFIVQAAGQKDYSLRKNTVQPWPLMETLPADMHYEREIMPIMKCRLEAGDWIYIPGGYWHVAQSEEASVSLSIGLMSRTAVDVLDALRRRLPASLLWRQRLLPGGAAAPLDEQALLDWHRQAFRRLADDLAREFTSEEFLQAYLRGDLDPDPGPLRGTEGRDTSSAAGAASPTPAADREREGTGVTAGNDESAKLPSGDVPAAGQDRSADQQGVAPSGPFRPR